MAQVAKIFTKVVPTRECFAADLKAEVVLVVPVVEARATNNITTVVPASPFRSADLGTHHFTSLCTLALFVCAATPAIPVDFLLALATCALVT